MKYIPDHQIEEGFAQLKDRVFNSELEPFEKPSSTLWQELTRVYSLKLR
jgi:hypothetical protein